MADTLTSDTVEARPQVFFVRVWYEPREAGESAVRIQARHVLSGETRYFLNWPALTTFLARKRDAASPTPIERPR